MIIGLSGYAQVGKDTVANYLVENYGFVKVSFADPIREALYKLDPKIRIDELTGASLASAVDHMGWEEVKRLSDQVVAEKMLQLFKEKANPTTKEVTYEQFVAAMYNE